MTKATRPKQRGAFRNKYLAALIAVMAFFLTGYGQVESRYSPINGTGFKYKRVVKDSLDIIPLSTSPHIPYRAGGIRYHVADSCVQLWTGTQWIKDNRAVQLTDTSFIIGSDTIRIVSSGAGGGLSLIKSAGSSYKLVLPPDSVRSVNIAGTWLFGDTTTNRQELRLGVDPQIAYGLGLTGADAIFVDTTGPLSLVPQERLRDTAAAIRAAIGSGGGSSDLLVSNGCIIGNSTIAEYLSQEGVEKYLMTTADSAVGSTVTNDAVPGHTIAQQRAVWEADSERGNYDWIIVEVGLNDLDPTESAATALARYQRLIDTINAQKKSSAKVLVATMTPVKQRMIDFYGATDGATAYQKWLDMNNAIMGGQPNKITGVDYRINNHTDAISDGNGNLATKYDMGDGVHENNAARAIIAAAYRNALVSLGYFKATQPDYVDKYFGNDTSHVYLKGGTMSPLTLLSTGAGMQTLTLRNTDGSFAGYTQMGFESTVGGSRVYGMGLANPNESFFGIPNSFYFYDATATAMRFIINPLGRIGFGVNDPLQRLHVHGNVLVDSSATIVDSISIGKGIRLTGTPTALGAVNTIHGTNSATAFSIVAGENGMTDANVGPFLGMMGNTYSAISSLRGAAFIGAGNVSSPTGLEGSLIFYTGATQQRARITPNGHFNFLDTAALTARFSYNTNLGSTFTRYSLVDKNYVDSSVAAGGGGSVTGTGTSGQLALWNGTSALTGNANILWGTSNGPRMSIGTTNTQGVLNVGGDKNLTSSGIQSYFAGATYTNTITAASGTASSATINYIAGPTIAATNTSVTFPQIATLGVDAPIAGANATITSPYAFMTGTNGHAKIQGNLEADGAFIAGAAQHNAVTTITSTGTLATNVHFVEVNATSGNITITLPAASSVFSGGKGIHYYLFRSDNSGNTITVQRAGSDTINSPGTSFTLTAQYDVKELQAIATDRWLVR